MDKFKEFVHKYPVRVAAFVSSTVALILAAVNPDMPADAAVVFVLSTLGLGEYAQRVENNKTIDALYTDPEDAE